MKAFVNFRGQSLKNVHVYCATDDDTDSAILDAALKVAGETLDSLFGWAISRPERSQDYVDVDLYID